ncbi:MAG: hypothetical protein ACODAC_00705 [Pseudomonadota bacterium]
MKPVIERLAIFVCILGLALPGPAGGQSVDQRHPVASRAGVVQDLDFGNRTMIISGYRYDVAVDAKVEISGSYGAFTMLRPGMKVSFDYQAISGTKRRIIDIREVPSDVEVEET